LALSILARLLVAVSCSLLEFALLLATARVAALQVVLAALHVVAVTAAAAAAAAVHSSRLPHLAWIRLVQRR